MTPRLLLERAVLDAVTAAGSRDAPALDEATARLAAHDPEHVRLVLGAAVRTLVEELYPDGVDADDVSQLIGAVAARSAWASPAEPILLSLVAGALGIHPDEPVPPAPQQVARQAVLLLAALLHARGRGPRPYLEAAFAEVERAQTMELP